MASKRNMEKGYPLWQDCISADRTEAEVLGRALDDAEKPLVDALREIFLARGTGYKKFVKALDDGERLLEELDEEEE